MSQNNDNRSGPIHESSTFNLVSQNQTAEKNSVNNNEANDTSKELHLPYDNASHSNNSTESISTGMNLNEVNSSANTNLMKATMNRPVQPLYQNLETIGSIMKPMPMAEVTSNMGISATSEDIIAPESKNLPPLNGKQSAIENETQTSNETLNEINAVASSENSSHLINPFMSVTIKREQTNAIVKTESNIINNLSISKQLQKSEKESSLLIPTAKHIDERNEVEIEMTTPKKELDSTNDNMEDNKMTVDSDEGIMKSEETFDETFENSAMDNDLKDEDMKSDTVCNSENQDNGKKDSSSHNIESKTLSETDINADSKMSVESLFDFTENTIYSSKPKASTKDDHRQSTGTTNESSKVELSDDKEKSFNLTSSLRDPRTFPDATSSSALYEKTNKLMPDTSGLIREQHFSRDPRPSYELGIPVGPVGGITGSGTTTTNREAASFLETLTEEEKRTRTRHVPDVEGFRRLHKSEIKSDLKVARSHNNFQPELFSRQASKLDRKGEFSALENQKANLIDIIPDDEEYYNAKGPLPTDKILNPFVAPEGIAKPYHQSSLNDSISSSGEGDESLSSGIGPKYQQSRNSATSEAEFVSLRSPKIIDCIKAFNPPRPPESIGSKKKNRLLRWERNPHEVEIDLDNYRKTVERTQEELQNAEKEREKVEVYGSIFRDHFMNHLRIMREESVIVNREFQSLQEDCKETIFEMLNEIGSTRNKCSTMADVISMMTDEDVLKSLADTNSSNGNGVQMVYSGIGGVTLDQTDISGKKEGLDFPQPGGPSIPLASGWILPGNKVRTSYGDGVVVKVFGVSFLEVSSNSDPALATSLNSASNPPNSKSLKKNHRHKLKPVNGGKQSANVVNNVPAIKSELGPKKNLVSRLLPPRIRVRLPFGEGYFHPDQVSILDEATAMLDSDLVSRWKKMSETAFLMKECVDTKAMDNKYLCTGMMRKMNKAKTNEKSKNSQHQDVENESMDTDIPKDNEKADTESNTDSNKKTSHEHHKRVTPFDGGLLSVPGWSGTAFAKIPLLDLQEAFEPILFNATGVMGKKSNPYLNSDLKFWEGQRYDLCQLQGTVLQLRNELSRQRGSRKLNERSRGASEDRSRKVENLFVEMKADLNSLKERLRDELSELGISQERAEDILADYSRELNDIVTDDENSLPQKRGKDSESASSNVGSRNTRRKLDEESNDAAVSKSTTTRDENMMEVSY